jgi:hypothetical protein
MDAGSFSKKRTPKSDFCKRNSPTGNYNDDDDDDDKEDDMTTLHVPKESANVYQ